MGTAERKDQHLDICLARDVSSPAATGLAGLRLEYDALPEMNLSDLDLSVSVLGKRLAAPVVLGALTGGTTRAGELNRRIASVASRFGLGMALGSQRAMIEDPSTISTFDVRRTAPELPLLIGNIGAVQLNYGVSVGDIEEIALGVGADAMAFHLNPLQEAIQPEGDTDFAGLSERLRAVVEKLHLPCLAKEVGCGLSALTAHKLAALGFAGVETAGLGGTSWPRVESYRCADSDAGAAIGQNLSDFGVPTAMSIRACREAFGQELVIASGGIRTGRDAAVALALGADAVALAAPVLKAAHEGEDALERMLHTFIEELRVVMFATGSDTPSALRGVRLLPKEVAP